MTIRCILAFCLDNKLFSIIELTILKNNIVCRVVGDGYIIEIRKITIHEGISLCPALKLVPPPAFNILSVFFIVILSKVLS